MSKRRNQAAIVLVYLAFWLAVQAEPPPIYDEDYPGSTGTVRAQEGNVTSPIPAYSVVGFEPPESALKWLANQKSPGIGEIRRNLAAIRKIVHQKGGPTSGLLERHLSANLTNTNTTGTIEDDINTINVLIGMLMFANRRLIEQRDRTLEARIDGPFEYQAASSELAEPTLDQSLEPTKPLAKTLTQRPKLSKAPGNKTKSNSKRKKKLVVKQDLDLVRPGYERNSDNDELEQAQSDERLTRRQDLFGHGHLHLPDHQPMVARDLLHVERPTGATMPPYRLNPPTSLPMLMGGNPGPVLSGPGFFSALARHEPNGKFTTGDRLVPPYNGHSISNWRMLGGSPDPQLHQPIHPMTALHPHEQRRLEHEGELRKRQEQVRREHEAVMQRQKFLHEQALARAQQASTTKQPHNDNSKVQENADSNGHNQQEDETPREQSGEEPESKGFGNMADTDFTDLFPPGILSEAEIKEMRRQQQEQRQQQQQEEEEAADQEQNNQEAEQAGNGATQEQNVEPPPNNHLSTGSNYSSAENITRPTNLTKSAQTLVGHSTHNRSKLPRPLALPNFLAGSDTNSRKTRRAEPSQQQVLSLNDWDEQSGYYPAGAIYDDGLDALGTSNRVAMSSPPKKEGSD